MSCWRWHLEKQKRAVARPLPVSLWDHSRGQAHVPAAGILKTAFQDRVHPALILSGSEGACWVWTCSDQKKHLGFHELGDSLELKVGFPYVFTVDRRKRPMICTSEFIIGLLYDVWQPSIFTVLILSQWGEQVRKPGLPVGLPIRVWDLQEFRFQEGQEGPTFSRGEPWGWWLHYSTKFKLNFT